MNMPQNKLLDWIAIALNHSGSDAKAIGEADCNGVRAPFPCCHLTTLSKIKLKHMIHALLKDGIQIYKSIYIYSILGRI